MPTSPRMTTAHRSSATRFANGSCSNRRAWSRTTSSRSTVFATPRSPGASVPTHPFTRRSATGSGMQRRLRSCSASTCLVESSCSQEGLPHPTPRRFGLRPRSAPQCSAVSRRRIQDPALSYRRHDQRRRLLHVRPGHRAPDQGASAAVSSHRRQHVASRRLNPSRDRPPPTFSSALTHVFENLSR